MLRRRLKHIYYSVGSAAIAGSRLKRLRDQGLAAILNLHRVSHQGSDYWPPLSPEVFEELLQFLLANFYVCDIRELGTIESRKPIAVLSFDDGYYDFVEYALPLLERYDMPANMNIIPQCAISGKPIWNVRLYDFLQTASVDEVNDLDIPGFSDKLERDDLHAKVRFGIALSRYLKNRSRREREDILASIEPKLDAAATNGTRMMTTEEIREISGRVTIGAHSFSHESMAYEEDSFFQADFVKCRSYFETELNIPLSVYAFPNGSYLPEQIEYLRQNAVEQILLVDEEFADVRSDVLTRLTIYGESGAEVKMKALGF